MVVVGFGPQFRRAWRRDEALSGAGCDVCLKTERLLYPVIARSNMLSPHLLLGVSLGKDIGGCTLLKIFIQLHGKGGTGQPTDY